jgi:hypothetical protein
VVLVGARDNPKGAVLVLPGEAAGEVEAVPLSSGLAWLSPGQALDLLCMQERIFGKSGLTPPRETATP